MYHSEGGVNVHKEGLITRCVMWSPNRKYLPEAFLGAQRKKRGVNVCFCFFMFD